MKLQIGFLYITADGYVYSSAQTTNKMTIRGKSFNICFVRESFTKEQEI